MQQTVNTVALPCHIHLQAIDSTRNIARDYQIDTCTDLFGYFIVSLSWGRIGTKGQSRVVSFAAERSARRFIRLTLVKRQSAKRRIGVAYVNV